jgi:hypothetical protein
MPEMQGAHRMFIRSSRLKEVINMAMRHLKDVGNKWKTRKAEDEHYELLRDRFMRLYPNLPICERTMPIVVLDISMSQEPLSWKVCYHEVKNRSGLGKRILDRLDKMEFI